MCVFSLTELNCCCLGFLKYRFEYSPPADSQNLSSSEEAVGAPETWRERKEEKESVWCSVWPPAAEFLMNRSAVWGWDEQSDITVLVCICSTCDKSLCRSHSLVLVRVWAPVDLCSSYNETQCVRSIFGGAAHSSFYIQLLQLVLHQEVVGGVLLTTVSIKWVNEG